MLAEPSAGVTSIEMAAETAKPSAGQLFVAGQKTVCGNGVAAMKRTSVSVCIKALAMANHQAITNQ
jgi:hypothetical protein